MWSMAQNARNTVLGNRSWDDIRAMAIDEAVSTVLLSINAHMSALEVSSKNDYDKVCMLSPAEAAAKREADAADKSVTDAAVKAEAEAATAEAATTEATAKAEADARPERTAAEAAIGVLAEAGREDLMSVMAHIVTRLSAEDLAMVSEQLAAIVANAAKDVTPLQIAA